MVDVIPIREMIKIVVEHPATVIANAAGLTAVGAVNKFATDLPYVHELLSDLSMLVGIVSVIMLIRIQYLKGKKQSLENDAYERRQRHLNSTFENMGKTVVKRRRTDHKDEIK